MGWKTVGYAKAGVIVRVSCEACGHKFEYRKKILETIESGGFKELTVRRKLQERLPGSLEKTASKLTKKEYKVCPQCYYVQSWMKRAYLRFWTWVPLRAACAAGVLGVPAWLILLGNISEGHPKLADVIAAVSLLIFISLIAK